MIENVKKNILQLVSSSDYVKGLNYDENLIEYVSSSEVEYFKKFQFLVHSESSFKKYIVQIDLKGGNVYGTYCTCPKFQDSNSCKHVASCLIVYSDQIFPMTKGKISDKSLQFLKKLENKLPNKRKIKREVFLIPYLSFESSYYHEYVALKVKIGLGEKMYSLLGKFSSFRYALDNNEPFSFGVSFTFDPDVHYFGTKSKELLEILDFIRKYYHINGNSVYVDDALIKRILKIYPNEIHMENPDRVLPLKNVFPLHSILSCQNDQYRVSIKDLEQIKPLTSDFEYVYYDEEIYRITEEESVFLKECYQARMDEIVVPKENFASLEKNVIRFIKSQISLDESVKDLVIGVNPDVKLYFDLQEDHISLDIHFGYNGEEISYFDSQNTVLRDIDYEDSVLDNIEKWGFYKGSEQFLLTDFDLVCEFLENGLEELSDIYEVFTTEKFKNMKILKKNTVSSTFSIGQDNILHYEFDLGEISEEELDEVFASLKQKKKYYRLKNGNILSLQEKSLQELEMLAEEFDLNETKTLPKYRALYLDSLKNSKYNIVKTDSLFEKFIQDFKQYQNVDVSFSDEELRILRDYQVLGVKWLYTIYKCGFGGILADEMGLGKSLQTIYFLRRILEEKKDAQCLIVCPTSLVYNWESEFLKFAPEISFHVFAEGKDKRREVLATYSGSVLITSYGLLREDLEFYNNKHFEVMVIDEAQNIKNPTAHLTKAVKKIESGSRFALTGTPIENSIVELWSIFDFIMPGFLSSLVKFQTKYKIKEMDEDTKELLHSLKEQVKPFILRRKKKEVIQDLPEKLENTIYIDLNESQKKIYAAEVKKANEEMNSLVANGGFAKNKMIILSLLTRLRQICISPEILLQNYHDGSSKLENLLKVIKELVENDHKILLFTSFKTALNLVKDMLEKENISNYTIAGDVSSLKRKMLVDAFNKDDTKVFLIMLKSGGTGLNLTSADVVIHLDLWWNPQAENQATDRTHRIGQTKNVSVIKLVCKGTIEEKILELQEKKKLLSDTIIDSEFDDSTYLKSLTEEDIRNLLSYENQD